MAIHTYTQPVKTEKDKEWLEAARRKAVKGDQEWRFLFNLKNRSIYDCINILTYRCVAHSDIFGYFPEVCKDDTLCIRFSFNIGKTHSGKFLHNYLGVPGLQASELYDHPYGLDSSIMYRLTKNDIDEIERYCRELEEELGEIKNELQKK